MEGGQEIESCNISTTIIEQTRTEVLFFSCKGKVSISEQLLRKTCTLRPAT